MEITAQDSALKVIEDDTDKMNSSDIKNFLNLLHLKNSGSFNEQNFLFNDDDCVNNVNMNDLNNIKSIYNMNDMNHMNSINNNSNNFSNTNPSYLQTYDSLTSLGNEHLEQPLCLEKHLAEQYVHNNMIETTKNQDNNMNDFKSNENLQNAYNKLNNNSLISCSNFWNCTEDELSTSAPQMAQKVEIFDY